MRLMLRTLSRHLRVQITHQAFFFGSPVKILLLLITFCSVETVPGTEGGGKYNCDYCQKDITGKIRIKCAVCPDFDLCVECMSVGAEITPHKCDHPYRVMVSLHVLFLPFSLLKVYSLRKI